MSVKNPTIAELIAAVTAVVPAITVDQARKMIRDNNIRSLTKASLVAVDHAAKTPDELAATFGPAGEVPVITEKLAAKIEEIKDSVSITDPKLAEQPEAQVNAASWKQTEMPVAAKKISAKGTTPRKTAVAVTPGPRGFRFGEVWTKSIKAGEGVAILPANRYKLIKHAEMYGIPANKDSDAVALAKQIAEALSAPKAEPAGETSAA